MSETLEYYEEECCRLRELLASERKQHEAIRRRAQEADSEQAKRKRAVVNLLRELEKVYDERRKIKHSRKVVIRLMRKAGVSCDTDLDSDPVVSAVKRLLAQRDEAMTRPWWKKLFGGGS
jgi:hypothetical protein